MGDFFVDDMIQLVNYSRSPFYNGFSIPITVSLMIKLTRLNNKTIYLNPDLMKSIEETPDTIISLINDDKYLVRETASEILGKIIDFRISILDRTKNPNLLLPSDSVVEGE